jgi:hypothetical protein
MKLTKISALLALSILIPQVAYAAPVQSIFASRAEGKNGQPLATITLWPGYGTNLNLIPTGEVIKKAWLDDPSRIAIDFDGCLARSGEGQGAAGDNCGTTVIHLRPITGVTFPGLTSSENATTLLTLIAEGSEGKKLYQFRVEMGKGAPQYNTLTVYPDSQGTPYIDVGLRKATVEDISKGLSLAEAQKLISRRDAAWSKVQNFLAQVRSGESVGSSLQRSGANMAIITKLAELSFAEQQPPIPPKEDAPKPDPVSQAPVVPTPQAPPSPAIATPSPQPNPPAIPTKPQALAPEPSKKMAVDVGYWLLDRGLADPEAWSRGSDATDYRILFDILRRGKESGAPFVEALAPAQKLSGVNDEELTALTRNLMTRSASAQPGKNAPAPVSAQPPTKELNQALKPSPSAANPATPQPAVDKGSYVLPSSPDEKTLTPEASAALAKMGSPTEVLARFEIPLKEGGAIRADKLLAVQQRIWLWKQGAYRKKLGTFISALVTSKETDPDRSLERAIEQSGLSLNDVRYLAKASQAGTEEPIGDSMPSEQKETEPSAASPRSEEPPTVSPAAKPQGSTRAILAQYQLPTQEGDYITADRLLDIQQSIWLVKRGIYRQKLGAFISTLVTSQEKDPKRSLEAAVQQSGLSLNDVQFLVKTAQTTTQQQEGKAEAAPTPLSDNRVDNATTVPSDAAQPVAKLPTGGTVDTLFKLRIPLERGGSVGAEQLLTAQEKIWNLEGGTVRKKLARFIATLTASAPQGNDQALEAAVRESGLSLNEVQSLLEFSNGPKTSSVGQLTPSY